MADEIAEQRQRRRRDRRPVQRPWQAALGVTAGVSLVNMAAFMLHAASSILFLVFLNAMQPFLIGQLGATTRQGSLSGTLLFYDELLSLFLALLWGSTADVLGTRPVAATGYIFIAVALYSFTSASKPWPDLLYARLLFAVGGSAVTSMLTGILNSYSATFGEVQWRRHARDNEDGPQREEQPLLLPSMTRTQQAVMQKQTHGRLAALTGLTTGCGALFSVFVLLRLPAILAGVQDGQKDGNSDKSRPESDEAIRTGTRQAFAIVAAISLAVAFALALGLKMDAPPSTSDAPSADVRCEGTVGVGEAGNVVQQPNNVRDARRQRLKARLQRTPALPMSALPVGNNSILHGAAHLARGTLAGFVLARKEPSLPLAYIGGALARASAIATTVFVPLLVTRFFYTSGRCTDVVPSPDIPADELKRRCRQAFVVASILSGVIQLVALLCAPLIGYLCDARTPAQTLLLSSCVGVAAYVAMGLGLPHDGDPRGPVAWVAAIGIGFAQIGAIVASLALCAKAKARLAQVATDSQSEAQPDSAPRISTPTSGAIAGAYSATGGLSILLVSKLGGWLSDTYAPAAFLLMAALAGSVVIASLIVVLRERRQS